MDDRPIDALARRFDRLERQNRRLRRAVALLGVAAVALAIPGAWRARPVAARQAERQAAGNPAADRSPAELVRERLDLSRRALDIITKSWSRGAPVMNQAGDVYAWSSRLMGTQIYLSMAEGEARVEDPEVYLGLSNIQPNPGRTAAFRDHLARMRAWEDRLRPLAKSGVLSTLGFLEVEPRRVQAELWLARERQKSGQR